MRRRRLGSTSAMVVLALGWLGPQARAEYTFTPVAVAGDPAPGLGGPTLGSFKDIQLNAQGDVAFISSLVGAGATADDNLALWGGRPENVSLILRKGAPAPGIDPPAEFSFLTLPILSESRSVAFWALLRGDGISDDTINCGNDDTLWMTPPSFFGGAPVLLARSDSPQDPPLGDPICCDVKGAAGGLRFTREICAPDDFIAAKRAELLPAPSQGVSLGVFAADRQGSRIVLRSGDDVPGASLAIANVDPDTLATTSEDRLAFIARTSEGGAVLFGTPDALQVVARSRTPLPAAVSGAFGGGEWRDLGTGSVGLNAAGEIAFGGSVLADGAFSNKQVLVAGAPGALGLVARERETSDDEGFGSFGRVVINRAGDVAFFAGHTSGAGPQSPLANGVWMTNGGGAPFAALIEGESADGLLPGEVISFIQDGPYMNEAGQVLVRAGYGNDVGFQNTVGDGLWIVHADGTDELVLREGDAITFDGNTGTVSSVAWLTSFDLSLSGGEDGRQRTLGPNGEVVFFLEVDTGAGFVGSVAWAEPAGGAFVADTGAQGGTCGDPTEDGNVTATDALFVLGAAVGAQSCENCVCDVDDSKAITATDALRVLNAAVGQAGLLACLPCACLLP